MRRRDIFKTGAKGILKIAGGMLILGASSIIVYYLGEQGKRRAKEGLSTVTQTKNAYDNYKDQKKRAESLGIYNENLYEDIAQYEKKGLYDDI